MSAILIVSIAAATTGRALNGQDVTGSIRGRVLGSSLTPAHGIRITAAGPQLLGVRTSRTGQDGYYELVALPPGDYSVHVAAIGSLPITYENVHVEIGRATTVKTVRLQSAALTLEPLRISASRQTIDLSHTDAGATLTKAEYEFLPGERDFKAMMTILPHVNDSHRGDAANSSGATGLENVYFIDGVNVTSPLKASRGTSLPHNFVRAVEVKTGGYEAQYGRGLGAVVNAVTYSGTNTFEASFFATGSHSALAADSKAQPTLRETAALAYDVGARIGGPVVRDRMWFSAAYNPRLERASRDVGSLGIFRDRKSAQVFAAKLSWRPAAETNLELSLFGDPTVHHEVSVPLGLPAGFEVRNADPYLARRTTGGVVGSLHGTALLGSRINLEFSIARAGEKENHEPETAKGKTEPAFRDNLERSASGGGGFREIANLHRWSAMFQSTITADRHTTTVGGEFEDVGAFRDATPSGGYTLERGADGTYYTTVEYYLGTFHNRVPAAFVGDLWRVSDRLSLSLGLRWSSQTLSAASRITAQRFSNEWQPRVGMIWQIDSARTQRVFASFGRFYQQLPLNLSTLWYLDAPYTVSQFATDPRVAGTVPQDVAEYPTLEADWATNIPHLEAENSDEISVGYERLVRSSKVGARVLYRRLRSSFQWGADPSTEKLWVLGTPGKGDFDFLPPPVRTYSALELSATGWVWNASYRMSYVLSKNRGNYTGLYMSDIAAANPGGNVLFMAPHQATKSTGLLPNDHTHVFKLSASRQWRFGITSGGSFVWESGSPLNELAVGPPPFGWLYSFVVPRGSAGRTPSLWDLDLRLSKDIMHRRTGYARINADLLNVGNPQRAVRLEELHYLRNEGTGFADMNPTYRTPIAYQAPMMARVGVEVTW